MKLRTVFRPLLSLLCLFLLFALAGCRQNPDQAAPADNGETAKPADENAGGAAGGGDQDQGNGRKRGPKAHVTFAGALQSEGDYSLDCNLGADKTLQMTLNPLDEKGPKVELKIANVAAAGDYQAAVTVHGEQEWTGTAKANLKSHEFGGARKRSGFNGDFSGDITGPGGKGTVTANFRRCIVAQ
jgi:hypothetical protein